MEDLKQPKMRKLTCITSTLGFLDFSHLWDGEGGGPLGPQYVQTDGAVAVDVGMVDAGGERELGRLEGVVCGEVDVQEENTSCNKTTTQ